LPWSICAIMLKFRMLLICIRGNVVKLTILFSIFIPSIILPYEKKIMKKFTVFSIPLVAMFCTLLLFSCASVDGDTELYSFCVFPESKTCLIGTFSSCQEGGQLGDVCPFTIQYPSSSSLSSSSIRYSSSSSSSSIRYSSSSSSSRYSSSSVATGGSGYSCWINGVCIDYTSYISSGYYTVSDLQTSCTNAGYTFTYSKCP